MQSLTAQTATAAVRRVSNLFSGPSLEVCLQLHVSTFTATMLKTWEDAYRVQRVLKANIVRLDALDCFELVLVLSDTADGDAQSVNEEAVGHCDIGRVGLERDTIILADDGPVAEGQVRREEGISTISISCTSSAACFFSGRAVVCLPLDEPSRAVLFTNMFSKTESWLWMMEKVLRQC